MPVRVPSLADYYAHRDDYVTRVCPERLNWGEYLGYHDLQEMGFSGNRVSIPGDWDYGEKE
jgi:hypothetical protein